jgi:hypothetical protein
LDVRRQVSSRHSAHLQVIDLCRWGRRRPEDATSRAGTRAPGSDFIIDIRRFLLGFRSLCAGSYIRTTKIVRGIPVVTTILRSLAAASSSSSSSTPDPDSSDNYPGIRASACRKPAEGGRLICMVAPNGDRSHNNSNRYPTIGRSEASDAPTSNDGLVRNLNPDFNAIRV